MYIIFFSKKMNLSKSIRNREYFIDNFNKDKALPMSMHPTTKLVGHRGCINNCTFNRSGTRLLTGCDDGSVWMWDVETRNSHPKIMVRPQITNVFTSNFLTENRFISGANDATPRVTTLHPDRATRFSYIDHHIKKVVSSFVYDENTFVTVSYDGTVRLFDIRNSELKGRVDDEIKILTDADYEYHPYQFLIQQLDYYQLGPQGGGGGPKHPCSSPHTESLLTKFDTQIFWVDQHPFDPRSFVISCGDSSIKFCDLRQPDNVDTYKLYIYDKDLPVTGVAYNNDGTKVACSVRYAMVHIIDLYSPESIICRSHVSVQTDKACSWLGDYVVSGSDDGTLFFYDQYGNVVAANTGPNRAHPHNVNVVTVHREKKYLATSGVDYFATLWEPRTLTSHDIQAAQQQIDDATQQCYVM